jgi:hypothetical protein
MLEDWLNNPEPVNECHDQTVMQIIKEDRSEESLKIFIQGAEKMMTVMPRHATEDERKFQSKEQMEKARDMLAIEMAATELPQEETEQ